jgi:signal peptidase I
MSDSESRLASTESSSTPPTQPPPVPGGDIGHRNDGAVADAGKDGRSGGRAGCKRTWGLSILLLLLCVVLPGWLLMTVVPVGIGSRIFVMPTMAMAPEIETGDWVYTNLRAYRDNALPARGEIVVLWTGDVPAIETREGKAVYFLKRVVGLPGETISISSDGKLLVNGVPAPELKGQAYVTLAFPGSHLRTGSDTFTVPPGEVYVLGDNSKHSYDSRFWGAVPAKALRGRVESCVWPLDRARKY